MLLDPRDARPRAARRGGRSRAPAATRASSSSCPPPSSRSSLPPRGDGRRGGRGARAARARTCAAARGGHRAARGRRRCTRSPRRQGELNAGDALRRRSRPSTASSRAASSSAPCRSTSRSAAPTARSPSTTRCARYLPELAALAADAPFHEGRDTGLASVRPDVASCCRARASRRRCASWERVRRRAALGRCGGASRAAPLVVGAAPAPACTGRSSCACPTRRRRSPTPRRSPPSPTRSSRWLAERHDAGEALAGRARRGASRRTAGRACRHGVEGELPTSTRASDARPARGCTRCSTSSSRSPSGSAARAELAGARELVAVATARRSARRAGARSACARAVALARRRLIWRNARARVAPRHVAAALTPRRRSTARLLARLRARAVCTRLPARPAPTRSPTRTSSSRSTSATSCTTAACPASTPLGVGAVPARACAAGSRRASRPRCSRGRPHARRRAARPRRWTSRCGRSPTPTTAPSLSTLPRARRARSSRSASSLVHRSAYQLKEADPHSWALPRLSGAPKAALVEIQADEYGGGRPSASTRRCSPKTMSALGPRRALRRVPRHPARRDAGARSTSCRSSACTGGCAGRSSGTSRSSR